jgi:hypothetical protein
MDECARIRPASLGAAEPSSGGGEAVSCTPVVASEDLLQGGANCRFFIRARCIVFV